MVGPRHAQIHFAMIFEDHYSVTLRILSSMLIGQCFMQLEARESLEIVNCAGVDGDVSENSGSRSWRSPHPPVAPMTPDAGGVDVTSGFEDPIWVLGIDGLERRVRGIDNGL